jgi:hypothetical protein
MRWLCVEFFQYAVDVGRVQFVHFGSQLYFVTGFDGGFDLL